MPATGFIQARTFESYAELPLKNVAVVIITEDGNAAALRLSDRSGVIAPIPVPVPDKSESLSPNPDELPYALVDIFAYLKDYELVEARNVQIFADTTTYQDIEMVPLAEISDLEDQVIIYDTPPQNL